MAVCYLVFELVNNSFNNIGRRTRLTTAPLSSTLVASYMNNDEDILRQIATAVDQANKIEMRVSFLLSLCLRPATPDYGFLLETAMHNTILSFGAKTLLIKRIIDYWGWDDLQKKTGVFDDVLRMRNAFAHTPTTRRQLLVYHDEGTGQNTVVGNEMIVESKEGRKLENIERSKAFDRFNKAHRSSIVLLTQIEKRIKQTLAQQEDGHSP